MLSQSLPYSLSKRNTLYPNNTQRPQPHKQTTGDVVYVKYVYCNTLYMVQSSVDKQPMLFIMDTLKETLKAQDERIPNHWRGDQKFSQKQTTDQRFVRQRCTGGS